MEKLLISACLCGINCKYNGGNNMHPLAIELAKEYELMPLCPEELGGLPTPRHPSEIIDGKAMMNCPEGLVDKTAEYTKGAEITLRLAQKNGIKKAVLKAKSPSCGSGKIYDGTFSHVVIDGDGITAKLLKDNGIEVYSEEDYKSSHD